MVPPDTPGTESAAPMSRPAPQARGSGSGRSGVAGPGEAEGGVSTSDMGLLYHGTHGTHRIGAG